MKNKKGNMVSDHTGAIIIAVVLLVILFAGLMSFRIPQKIAILFGSVPEIEDVTQVVDGCPYKVGYVTGESNYKTLILCKDGNCLDPITTPIKLFVPDPNYSWDARCGDAGDLCITVNRWSYYVYKVGHVYNNLVIINYKTLIRETGDDYINSILPSDLDYLANLNGALYYGNKYFCRDKKTDLETYKRETSIGSVVVDGKKYYYDLYSFVFMMRGADAAYGLYSSESLSPNDVASYYLDRDGAVFKITSSNEKETGVKIPLKHDIKKEVKSADYELIDSLSDNGYARYKIINKNLQLSNEDGRLGINSKIDKLVYIEFKNIKDVPCMRFTDYHMIGKNDVSDWFTIRYWNYYGKFPILPEAIRYE